MAITEDFPMDTIEQMLLNVAAGAKKLECEGDRFHIKVYRVNSSAKYANPSIRVDIQDLELADFS